MKSTTITTLLILISIFSFAQKQKAEGPKPDSIYVLHLNQMQAVYLMQMIQVAPQGFLDTQLSGVEIKKRMDYGQALSGQLNAWLVSIQPAPVPKNDSTGKK